MLPARGRLLLPPERFKYPRLTHRFSRPRSLSEIESASTPLLSNRLTIFTVFGFFAHDSGSAN